MFVSWLCYQCQVVHHSVSHLLDIVYHDVQAKCTRTTVLIERKVKGELVRHCLPAMVALCGSFCWCAGFGLRCHRAIIDICKLVGVKDVRAKIYGSTNPRNIVRATFKAFSMQVSTCVRFTDSTTIVPPASISIGNSSTSCRQKQ